MRVVERQPIRLVEARETRELADLDDDALMLLVRSGRQDAFEVLMRRHQPFVFGLATRYLADRASGRDVMQDVFLALWRERERYKPSGRFRSYLASVTFHRCHTVARSKKGQLGRAVRAADDPAADELPVDVLVERERSREVRALLSRVPEHHRRVLVLRFGEELELEEIAAATGHPLGTVKSHLFRGLKLLRELVRKESSS
jgi:RNA polymerase sigma-70 factor (ECF subfamily)